jgi:hypothetical protein
MWTPARPRWRGLEGSNGSEAGGAVIGLRKPLVREPQIPLTSQTDETHSGVNREVPKRPYPLTWTIQSTPYGSFRLGRFVPWVPLQQGLETEMVAEGWGHHQTEGIGLTDHTQQSSRQLVLSTPLAFQISH